MRKWIDLLAEKAEWDITQMTTDDVTDYYKSHPEDLHTLIDGYDDGDGSVILNTDYTSDIALLKPTLIPLAQQETITVYRALRASVGIDLNGLGIHWSIDPETDFGNTLVTAQVSPDCVDWVGTVARGVHWWNDEKELTLKSGCPIYVVSVADREGIDPNGKSGWGTA
jgi:hypothetical protein